MVSHTATHMVIGQCSLVVRPPRAGVTRDNEHLRSVKRRLTNDNTKVNADPRFSFKDFLYRIAESFHGGKFHGCGMLLIF